MYVCKNVISSTNNQLQSLKR